MCIDKNNTVNNSPTINYLLRSFYPNVTTYYVPDVYVKITGSKRIRCNTHTYTYIL